MNVQAASALPSRWASGRLTRADVPDRPGHRPLVVKVGGSLLERRDWPALLADLLTAVAPADCCLVVGGGPVVEGLRAIDRAAPRPVGLMHELSIEAMRLTARLVAAALGLPVSGDVAPAAPAVLDVPAWLTAFGRAASLPAGWEVTSDSIAARVAVAHGRGLLLVKSVPPPPCPAGAEVFTSIAAAGWVDAHFPVAAASLDAIDWAAPAAVSPS